MERVERKGGKGVKEDGEERGRESCDIEWKKIKQKNKVKPRSF